MEYRVTDIITLLNAEYKGEVIEKSTSCRKEA